jgi:hypothetical protein
MFQRNTRRKLILLSTQAKGSTNPVSWDIPKTGLLSGVWLNITGSIAGTLSALNPLGKSSIVRRVRLVANSGIDLINISGPQFHYLLRDHVEDYKDPTPASDGRSAVATGVFDISMFLPVAVNTRDPLGLFMLQNEATQLQLSVEFEADSSVATGATVTCSVTPAVEIYTVPVAPENWPPLNVIHQIVGDDRAVSGAGEVEYKWPRGNTYVQCLHGFGMGVSATDPWTRAKVMVNQSEVIADYTPGMIGLEHARSHGRARLVGTIPVDLIGTDGLGVFGGTRDLLYSASVTELATVITATGAGTLNTVRRQLVALK